MPQCYLCRQASAPLQCSRCKEARYCTKECQAKHWKLHKDMCQQIAEIKGFVPPSASSSTTGSNASSALTTMTGNNNLSVQEPSEEDLRIAWAIAAVSEVNRHIASARSTVPLPTVNDTVPSSSTATSTSTDGTPVTDDDSSENTVTNFVPALNAVQNWNFSGMVPDVPPKQFSLYSICNTSINERTNPSTASDDSSNLASNSPLTDVAQLLQEGAVVDPPEAFGIPLHGAVSAGRLSIVRYLLEHGASVNRFTRTGQTALQLAVLGNYTDIIQLLLQYGANIFCSLTPPSPTLGSNYAANEEDTYSSSYLVNRYHHRNVLTNFDPQGNGGIHERTLLHFIAMQDTSNDGKSVDLLCNSWCQALSLLVNPTMASIPSHAPNTNNTNTSNNASSVSSISIPVPTNRPVPFCGVDPLDEDNCTPLLYAAVHANIGAVKILLKYGANPGKRDTTIMVPSPSNNTNGSSAGTGNAKLTNKGSTVPLSTESSSITPASPLVATLEPAFIASLATMAALHDNSDPTEAYTELQEYIEIIKLLIDAGGELPNECTVDPEDIEWKFPGVSRLPPPPPPPPSSSSLSPSATLHSTPASFAASKLLFTPFAALCSQIPLAPIVSALLQKAPQSCNPHLPNSDSSTSLIVAISAGNVTVVKELIKYGIIPATHNCTVPTWESSLIHTAYHRAASLVVPSTDEDRDTLSLSNTVEGYLVTDKVLAELKELLKI